MLKYTLAASAAVAAVLALTAPSFAADASSTVTITGQVGAACSISPATASIDLGTLTTNPDGSYAGAPLSGSVTGTAWCNGNTNTLTATAKPLVNAAGAATSGFTSRIDYTLSTGINGVPTLSTAGGPVAGTTVTTGAVLPAFSVSGTGTGSITTLGTGTNKVVAGTYTGEVIVTLTPGV